MYLRWTARKTLEVPSYFSQQGVQAANALRRSPNELTHRAACRSKDLNHLAFDAAVAIEESYNLPVTIKPNTTVDNITPLSVTEIKGSPGAGEPGVQRRPDFGQKFLEWSYHGAYEEWGTNAPQTDEFDSSKVNASGKKLVVKGANIITRSIDKLPAQSAGDNEGRMFHDWDRYRVLMRELMTAATDGSVYMVDGSVGSLNGSNLPIRVMADNLSDAMFYKAMFGHPSPATSPLDFTPTVSVWSLASYRTPNPEERYALAGPTWDEGLKLESDRFTLATDQHFFSSVNCTESFGALQRYLSDTVNGQEGNQAVLLNADAVWNPSAKRLEVRLHNGESTPELETLRKNAGNNLFAAHQVIVTPAGVSRVYNGVVTGDNTAEPLSPAYGSAASTDVSQIRPPAVPLAEVTFMGNKDAVGSLQHNLNAAKRITEAAAAVQKRWDAHESFHGSEELAYHTVHLEKEALRHQEIASRVTSTFREITLA